MANRARVVGTLALLVGALIVTVILSTPTCTPGETRTISLGTSFLVRGCP